MATRASAPGAAPRSSGLLRFDRVQRGAHWVNAALFGVLIVTGWQLYFGSLGGVVLPRHLVAEIHLWTGVSLPVPLLVSLLGRWGARMRRDARRVSLWTRDELDWLWGYGRGRATLDKFNPGQKLNAVFTAATIALMLGTGSVLAWFRFFPVTWRTGATLVHDTLAFAVVVVLVGHVALALAHPTSLRSMFTGRVPESWAARHAPGWLAEQARVPPPP